jgi:hypothetical protein
MNPLHEYDNQKRREGRRQVVTSAAALTALGFVFAVTTTSATPEPTPSDPRITQQQYDRLADKLDAKDDTIAELTELVADCQSGVPPCVTPQSAGGTTLVTRYSGESDDSDDSDDDGGATVVVRPQVTTPPKGPSPKPTKTTAPENPVSKTIKDTTEAVTENLPDLPDVVGSSLP